MAVTMISYDIFPSHIQCQEEGLYVLHIFLPKSPCYIQASAMYLEDSYSMLNILRPKRPKDRLCKEDKEDIQIHGIGQEYSKKTYLKLVLRGML